MTASVGSRQLFVDVSTIVRTNAGTGIQRVVVQLLRQWMAAAPDGWRVEPVYSPGGGQPWRYARRYAASLAGKPRWLREQPVIESRPGDVFLGLDLNPGLGEADEAMLLRMREQGVKVVFAVYDLLPVRIPAAFAPGMEDFFNRWLRTIARVADGVVAISRATAEDFARWLKEHPPQRSAPLRIGWFTMGADMPRVANARLGWWARGALERATSRPAFLMVGTVEPRKGHAQALDALEQLWRRGVDLNLVIVGKAGWMTGSLVQRLRQHPERKRRLHWFGHAPDALLEQLYRSCSALLAASHGEGFGLPLIEAAQHRLPIVARELPVFREVAGEHAFYFEGNSAEDLAAAIERWLALQARGAHPRSHGLAPSTWERSARSLEEVVLGDRWLMRWPP